MFWDATGHVNAAFDRPSRPISTGLGYLNNGQVVAGPAPITLCIHN